MTPGATPSPSSLRGRRPILTRQDADNARQSVWRGALLGTGTLGLTAAALTVWGMSKADDLQPRYDADSRRAIRNRPSNEKFKNMVDDDYIPTRDFHMDGTASSFYQGSKTREEIAERMRAVRQMTLRNYGIRPGHIDRLEQLPNPDRQKVYRALETVRNSALKTNASDPQGISRHFRESQNTLYNMVNQVLGNSALLKAEQRRYRALGAFGGFIPAAAAGVLLATTVNANNLNPFRTQSGDV